MGALLPKTLLKIQMMNKEHTAGTGERAEQNTEGTIRHELCCHNVFILKQSTK